MRLSSRPLAGTVEIQGRLDYAVNNVGTITDRQSTHELSKADWDHEMSTRAPHRSS